MVKVFNKVFSPLRGGREEASVGHLGADLARAMMCLPLSSSSFFKKVCVCVCVCSVSLPQQVGSALELRCSYMGAGICARAVRIPAGLFRPPDLHTCVCVCVCIRWLCWGQINIRFDLS